MKCIHKNFQRDYNLFFNVSESWITIARKIKTRPTPEGSLQSITVFILQYQGLSWKPLSVRTRTVMKLKIIKAHLCKGILKTETKGRDFGAWKRHTQTLKKISYFSHNKIKYIQHLFSLPDSHMYRGLQANNLQLCFKLNLHIQCTQCFAFASCYPPRPWRTPSHAWTSIPSVHWWTCIRCHIFTLSFTSSLDAFNALSLKW